LFNKQGKDAPSLVELSEYLYTSVFKFSDCYKSACSYSASFSFDPLVPMRFFEVDFQTHLLRIGGVYSLGAPGHIQRPRINTESSNSRSISSSMECSMPWLFHPDGAQVTKLHCFSYPPSHGTLNRPKSPSSCIWYLVSYERFDLVAKVILDYFQMRPGEAPFNQIRD
jgi:hypothetical protein